MGARDGRRSQKVKSRRRGQPRKSRALRYTTMNEVSGEELFYYFVPSERNLSKDPVLFWLTGVPGCSAFSGFAMDMGYDLYGQKGNPVHKASPHKVIIIWSGKIKNQTELNFFDSRMNIRIGSSFLIKPTRIARINHEVSELKKSLECLGQNSELSIRFRAQSEEASGTNELSPRRPLSPFSRSSSSPTPVESLELSSSMAGSFSRGFEKLRNHRLQTPDEGGGGWSSWRGRTALPVHSPIAEMILRALNRSAGP
ncbi:Serine carboxypeptidase-like 20 [Platanthera guangdongensis]|uniref:Serine carboxypeptidase-like 20 n=1 Tax=Platanthera guangdongensis TaxID=2320717 RepID=A0ABR2LYQ9_9ASPA